LDALRRHRSLLELNFLRAQLLVPDIGNLVVDGWEVQLKIAGCGLTDASKFHGVTDLLVLQKDVDAGLRLGMTGRNGNSFD
jgi:hypothetical protein